MSSKCPTSVVLQGDLNIEVAWSIKLYYVSTVAALHSNPDLVNI